MSKPLLAAVIWLLANIGDVLVFSGAFESRNTKRANAEIAQVLYDPYGAVTGAAMVCGFVNAKKKLGCHRAARPNSLNVEIGRRAESK